MLETVTYNAPSVRSIVPPTFPARPVFQDWRQLPGLPDTELARVDPVAMNLLVAKGIPGLAHLAITGYQREADRFANDVRVCLPAHEKHFWRTPQDWRNDIHFFRLGVLCWYVDEQLHIRYREDHKDPYAVSYADPSTL